MSMNLKITKNVNRVLARLNHDFKNIHLFSSKKISSREFDFKKNLNHKISDKFIIKISNLVMKFHIIIIMVLHLKLSISCFKNIIIH